MSRNSKNARLIREAREMSKARQNGSPGPAQTTPKHGKKCGYRTNPAAIKALAEFLKGKSEEKQASGEKTAGKAILRKAGKASKQAEEATEE